jgi:hypothetical protein
MMKKLNRAGIAAIVLAGVALAGTSLPAQAVEPGLSPGTEYLFNYYSNPQRTILVGVRSEGFGRGCVNSSWGQTTNYVYITSYPCSENGPDHDISR